ncbi:MAG: hypothetical protein CUN55_01300 [Phototrophicales bacterium]|nr:MAG: hypothetical protein CUN55_01300 [Phototrophicales bacterium]
MNNNVPLHSTRSTEHTNWRHLLLFIALVLMEGLWLAPWLHYLLASPLLDNPVPMSFENMTIFVFFNMFFGLIVRRTLVYYRIPFKNQQLPIIGMMVISILASIAIIPALTEDGGSISFDYVAAFRTSGLSESDVLPIGYIITPFVMLLYSRGTMIGRYPPEPIVVGVRSRFAILMFFFVSVLVNDVETQNTLSVLLPFFFAAILLSNALARSTSLKTSATIRRVRFGRQWALTLLGSTVFTVSVGIVTAALLGSLNQEQVQRILAVPLFILGAIGVIVSTPFLFIIGVIAEAINIENIAPEREITESGTREVVASADNPQINIGDELRTLLDSASTVIVVGVLVLFALIIVLFWVSYFLSGEKEQLEEAGESISERENIGVKIFSNIKGVLNRLTDLPKMVGGNLFSSLTIRWAYARMEYIGRKRGYPRLKSQTPYEYIPALMKAFPEGESHIRTITNAYVAIRYGELPENEGELNQVRQALDTLKTLPAPKK